MNAPHVTFQSASYEGMQRCTRGSITLLIAVGLLVICQVKRTKTYGEDPPAVALGKVPVNTQQSHCVAIGVDAMRNTMFSNVVCIGDGAQATKNNQLVLKFEDGTELRQDLPPGKVVDLRRFRQMHSFHAKEEDRSR